MSRESTNQIERAKTVESTTSKERANLPRPTRGKMDDVKERVPLADKLSLSPEQASELSGIGLTRIREAIADRTLIAHKHGSRTIVLPDDLKAWLRSLPLAGDEKKDRPE
jgi:hypothetical protein